MEQRVNFAWDKYMIGELLALKHDQKKNRVDHPPAGSKDSADALAGVVYGLSTYVKPTDIGRYEVWAKNIVPGDMKVNPSQFTGVSVAFDSAFDRDDFLAEELRAWDGY